MGSGPSTASFDYEAQLAKDGVVRGVAIGDKKAGESRVYRHPERAAGDLVQSLDQTLDEAARASAGTIDTLWKAFEYGANTFPDRNCLYTRKFDEPEKDPKKRGEYIPITYKNLHTECVSLGRGLKKLFNLAPQDAVGIYAGNRHEWTSTFLAIASQNLKTVAMYDTLGPEAIEHILSHAEIKVLLVEKSKLKKLYPLLSKAEHLKALVQIDVRAEYNNTHETVDGIDKAKCADDDKQLVGYSEVLAAGAAEEDQPDVQVDIASADDVAYLMYTSGTTGVPKGAILLHRNIIATVAGTALGIPDMKEADGSALQARHLSYLPMAHIFETCVQVYHLFVGSSIYFQQGNIKMLTVDLVEVRPTHLAGVPRVYSKIFDKVMAAAVDFGCIKKFLFYKGLKASSEAARLYPAGDPRSRVEKWDNMLWSKLAAKIGFDEVRWVVSGAAPLSPYLAEFLKVVCLKGAVTQGYGLTETCAGATMGALDDITLGHVGGPSPCAEIKLRDVAEMGYLSTDKLPRGEVLIRGPSVFAGYYKNAEATAKDITEDGWFCTGDVGRWNANGSLSIIDRKKNIFKLSQGEYIASEKIENVYAKSPAVSQIWIYGNSYKSFVVAVIVPDAAWAVAELKKMGAWKSTAIIATPEFSADFLKACTANAEALKVKVLESIRELEGPAKLKRFETARDIFLEFKIDELLRGWHVDNGLLTPTFKIKRPALLNHYIDDLKQLYSDNGEPPKADEIWLKKKK